MIPEFMRYYRYSLEAVLELPARSFLALLNSYLRLAARARLQAITDAAIAQSDSPEARSIVDEIQRQAKGNSEILRQAKLIRSFKQ